MIKIFFSEILHMSSTQNDSAQFKDPMCCSIKLIGICPDLCVCITQWEEHKLMLHILKNMSHFKSCFFFYIRGLIKGKELLKYQKGYISKNKIQIGK